MNLERSKNYYEILALDPFCSPEDIKQAFRHQIALSHPDKVSHLDREIQEWAFRRTTELTEAYRILSNGDLRSDYNRQLQYTVKSAAPTSESIQARKNEEPSGCVGKDEFIFQTGVGRLKSAVQEALPRMDEVQVDGFDAAFASRRKWNILSSSKGCVQVLMRALPLIDSPAVEDGWNAALKAARGVKGDVYLFLMGGKLDGADKLSTAILASQRRTRLQDDAKILVIPLNVNSFAALIPNGAPDSLRAIIRALK